MVIVILLFLWHPPSAVIPILTIPLTVWLLRSVSRDGAFVQRDVAGGIAIATGALVDAAIVVVEQTHKKLEEWQREGAKAMRTASS